MTAGLSLPDDDQAIRTAVDWPRGLGQQESLGGWCAIPSWLSAELVGRAGFDWVCVDTQHGPIGTSELAVMLQSLAGTGVPSLVRVPWNEPAAIYRALDAGASGVIVPLVNSAEEARAAVRACRYPPTGDRSYGPTVAGLRRDDFTTDNADSLVACIVQIETAEALSRVGEIADVAGLDGLFVGPADLALSLGTPLGDVADIKFREATRLVVDASRAQGLAAGMFCGSAAAARIAREDGFGMLAIQSDVRFLRAAMADALNALRSADA